MQKWIIKPTNTPIVLRTCSKCGGGSQFICGGNFRINANGKNIDIWLIYKCNKCDSTWNMSILSRVKPHQIEQNLYLRFAKNDFLLAQQYAFDKNILGKNNAVVDFSMVEYVIEKQILPDGNDTLEITCAYDFGLRIDKLLSDTLGISRAKSKLILEQNNISTKCKLNDSITIKEISFDENKN